MSSWSAQICGLVVWAVQVLIENFGHGKHVYPILLEDSTHCIVTEDVASVTGILKFMFVNILPDFLDRLGSR